MLPDFLVIGAMKSGTTWLYNMLKQHPNINMAKDRKEVHFFDRYYDRGIDWYKNKFKDTSDKTTGEVTPDYLHNKECAYRIKKIIPNVKLICVLRNPVNRIFSEYKYIKQNKNYNGDFRQFINETNYNALEKGLYYKQLEPYFKLYDSKNIEIIIFEKLIQNEKEFIKKIYKFLGVDSNFIPQDTNEKANVSKIPRFKKLYSMGKIFVEKLYDWDLLIIINLLKKLGLKKLFFFDKKPKFVPMSKGEELFLYDYYEEDVEKLQKLIDQNAKDIWGFN